jgi:hypothetical protein
VSNDKITQATGMRRTRRTRRGTRAVPASPAQVPTLFDVQEMELNFGPQHPSTHGVLRLVLKVDGEKILEAKPDVGYLHRGTEKLFETETYPMGIPHTDRMDYIAAATNNHAFCLDDREAARRRDPAPRAADPRHPRRAPAPLARTSSGSAPPASTSAR